MSNRSHDGQYFEPGPSFTEEVPGDQQVSELPSWLRNFAETIEDSESSDETLADTGLPDPSVALDEGDDNGDPTMPGWLSTQRSASTPSGNDQTAVGQGFFSEDDLPDWLRALNSDDVPAAASSFGPASEGSPEFTEEANASRVLTVPAVSNVWVTGMEERVENPGATLFAMIASGGASRPDLAVATMPRPGQSTNARNVAPQASEAQQPDGGRTRTSWSRRERILLVAVILMSIVLLVLININIG